MIIKRGTDVTMENAILTQHHSKCKPNSIKPFPHKRQPMRLAQIGHKLLAGSVEGPLPRVPTVVHVISIWERAGWRLTQEHH